MKDEIKEIIIRMSSYTIHYDCCSEGDAEEDIDILLDYITNLQEELAFIKKDYKKVVNSNDDNIVIIYKAIEWVKKNMYYFPRPDELLNILKGDDKE